MDKTNIKCIVLYANPYQIKDENTDKITLEGISITYIITDNLNPIEDRDKGSKGIAVAKCSIPLDSASQIRTVPALYDVEFEMKIVQGKPVIAPKNFSYLSDIQINEVKEKVGK